MIPIVYEDLDTAKLQEQLQISEFIPEFVGSYLSSLFFDLFIVTNNFLQLCYEAAVGIDERLSLDDVKQFVQSSLAAIWETPDLLCITLDLSSLSLKAFWGTSLALHMYFVGFLSTLELHHVMLQNCVLSKTAAQTLTAKI